MTSTERAQIIKLQKLGYGYKRIATETGLPPNAVKTFCRRNPLPAEEATDNVCRHCGKWLEIVPGRKKKLYCSDACRMAWWKEHRDQMNKRTFYECTCQHCGKQFQSYGNSSRKYCSRDCYDQHRTGVANNG